MANLTTTFDNKILDHINLVASYTPTTPLKLALVTVAGSAGSAGTEVTGGSYARQTITFASAASGSAANSNTITYAAMPACTVVGVEIWDNAGTPVRLWFGTITSRTFLAGDSFSFAASSVTVSLT
ncbi:MAG: hypothetical protein JWN52_5723 [Actinomycetia bacterium]|nr:hypothetical protein [Actinomycetes bacterium]